MYLRKLDYGQTGDRTYNQFSVMWYRIKKSCLIFKIKILPTYKFNVKDQ